MADFIIEEVTAVEAAFRVAVPRETTTPAEVGQTEALAARRTFIAMSPDKWRELLASFREQLAAYEKNAAADPGNPEWQSRLAQHHVGAGEALAALGNIDAADAEFRVALFIYKNLEATAAIQVVVHRWHEIRCWHELLCQSFAETKKPDYNQDIMNKRAEFYALADDVLEQLSTAEFKEAIDAKLTAKAQLAARETTGRAKAEPRPKWDRDRLPDETPAAFAWRAYQAEAKAGTLHRGVIAKEDKPLAVKLTSWLRSHPMPEGIDIPTLPEWNSRQLAKLKDEATRDVVRLYEVARSRRRKQATLAA